GVPRDRARDSLFERHGRRVIEKLACLVNRWDSKLDFRARVRLKRDLGARAGQAENHPRELEVRDGALWIAEIERVSDRCRLLRTGEDALNEILHVTPRANLRAIAVEHDRLVLERLQNNSADRAVANLPRSV